MWKFYESVERIPESVWLMLLRRQNAALQTAQVESAQSQLGSHKKAGPAFLNKPAKVNVPQKAASMRVI